MGRCYICGRVLGNTQRPAYLEDDDHRAVYIGVECLKALQLAGGEGIKGGKGRGPRVFASPELARAWN